jgi:hypothetical protein
MKTSNCVINTSVFHAAVMACAILSSSLSPSEPALAQGCPTPSFGPPRWFNVGTYSHSLGMGDFNGDGKLDLAVVNIGGSVGAESSVSVLLGNGDGTFQASINSAAGTASRPSVVVGDFNGDGKLDLALSAGDSGAVSVLLGNGDGTFQAPINYDAGTDPTIKVPVMWVAAGDFNRDGKLDLVVANKGTLANNFTDSSVSVLLGNGDGTFQAAAEYGPVVNSYCVAVGDFNGDGNLDLAVANAGSLHVGAGVSVLLGNGDGTFQSAVTYDAGVACFLVTVADFNGDGKPDLAVLGENDGVLLGNGDGTFQAAIQFDAAGVTPSSVAVGDFNGDGKLDLAVANAANGNSPSGTIAVLLGNGDGTLQTAVTYALGTNADPECVAVGDFNGDGKPDLAVADFPYEPNSGGVAVLLNTCASTAPALSIVSSNSTLILSWPLPSTGFVLESTPSLRPPNWQPAPESAVTNNALLEVLVPVSPGSRYFRLHKP